MCRLKLIVHNNVMVISLWFTLLLPTFGFQANVYAQNSSNQSQIPKEVSELTGTFTGVWAVFGVDEKGQPVRKMAWTDTIRAENPIIKGDRAFVTTTDEMVFEGGRIPPMKVKGTEGYFLNKDGSLGEYFIETYGQLYRVRKLEKDVWVYTTKASPQELTQLGFTNVISAQHVVLKVVTQEQGAETHRITRMTTVNWKDAKGEDRWIQYVSLQGLHKRQ